MKQKCPTYLKSVGKSKALATTLSDTEPEDDSDNEDDGILNAVTATLSDTELEDDTDDEDDGILNTFTTTVNPTEKIFEDVDEEEELVEFKFEKMDEQDDIHTAYAKL